MATRGAVALLVVGALLSGAAGFAAATDNDGRLARVYDPRVATLDELAEKLKARERSLERREQSVQTREEVLRQEEGRLTERATELTTLRAEIVALQQRVDAEHAERVATVVRTVEAMKPAAASPMIQKLDLPLAIEVMQQMSSTKAGKLLAALPPGLAARIAEGLAGPGGAVGTAGVAPGGPPDAAAPRGAP